ncbi:TonB-dependent receptor [Lacihabitans sp. LS3-19]|uniref:TonB-dependent receptor n=1 Tax=Lacihabitans sp. LS3-19 TaxID=2487335 RepID=UPI0020CFC55B|nr:carboxypeptidase regulatory-like domain-containing protein [Lacihabitans sp. LS3-19]MCP9767483.1 TonB-dependent receptor [Lacihabitans sp. LS3-19]
MNQKTTYFKKAIVAVLGLVLSFSSFAQVTSSAISGLITDNKNEGLPGATIIALHVPSGTKYAAMSDVNGRYAIPSVRVGGPYRVSVSFVGFKDQVKEGVIANLGTAANVSFSLSDNNTTLDELVVRSDKSDVFSSGRTGAATTIGKEQINSMPTIGRTINDFTRLTPQASGKSFGGQDTRLNNITIDGAVFNNGFGLGDQPGARVGISPISLDAIEEVQVNIAPFDVRQTGFTGAGINAVTRSGNNQVQGSVFTMFRDNGKAFLGTKVNDETLTNSTFKKNVYGFRLGGPIIKDKVFFFVNAELESLTTPGTTWQANRGQTGSNVTRTLATDLDAVSAQMSKLGFETGPYENYNFSTTGNKFLARVDWNINQKNKFNIRVSKLDGGSQNPISNSTSAGAGNRGNNSTSMSYFNSGYVLNEDYFSTLAELNTTISNKLSNNLIVGYTKNNEDRAYLSDRVFPTIDILQNNSTYISAGFDPFTPNNLLNYSTFQFFDNLTYYAGKHVITGGIALERFISNNSFYAASNGVYVYNSLDDFFKSTNDYLANPNNPATDVTINRFQYRFDFAGGAAPPLQVMKATTPGIYIQDEYQAKPNLKFTIGLRVDIPLIEQTSLENTVVSGLSFKDETGATVKYNTGVLPTGNPLWSPRLGFNWDVKSDKTIQVRGGSGIFTGRPPFVWLSNQIGNNGILSGFTQETNTNKIAFTLDPSKYKPATADPYAASTFDIAVADENYKFPQVWKTNIAVDYKLPGGIIATGEFIYSKNINAVQYINSNLKDPVSNFAGPDTRPRFAGGTANRINSNITNNIVLKSSNIGGGLQSTIKLEKPFANGLYAMAAYTYGSTKDITNAGSIAFGSWSTNPIYGTPNTTELTNSNFNQRHRAILALNYKLNYGKKLGGSTTFSLFYEGRNQGNYSLVYAGDMNQDGLSNNDLLFIPNKGSDMTFLPLTSGGKTFSPEEQATAFEKFISQNSQLDALRGTYVKRNSIQFPWYNSTDFSVIQDIKINAGSTSNALQVRFDILNVGNLLNSKWGVLNRLSADRPLAAAGVNASGVPQFRMATQQVGGQTVLLQDSYVPSISTGSVWGAQLSVRYSFN